jgi:hypothetical protein
MCGRIHIFRLLVFAKWSFFFPYSRIMLRFAGNWRARDRARWMPGPAGFVKGRLADRLVGPVRGHRLDAAARAAGNRRAVAIGGEGGVVFGAEAAIQAGSGRRRCAWYFVR